MENQILQDIDKVIYVFHPRRSGGHGIQNWLCNHIPNPVLFLNNIKIPELYSENFSVLFSNVKRNIDGHTPKHIRSSSRYVSIDKENINTLSSIKNISVVMSHEDYFIESDNHFIHKEFANTKKYFVYIIRDVFNCVASRIKYAYDKTETQQLDFIFLIKEFYKYFLSSKQDDNIQYILYNKWYTDENYRRYIIKWFNLQFTDACFGNFIMTTPGFSYTQNASSRVEVFSRWKTAKDNRFFKLLLDDKELVQMCEHIFGFNVDGS